MYFNSGNHYSCKAFKETCYVGIAPIPATKYLTWYGFSCDSTQWRELPRREFWIIFLFLLWFFWWVRLLSLQKHIIQANGTNDHFNWHCLLIWKIFLLQSSDLEGSIIIIVNTWELLHLTVKELPMVTHLPEGLAPLILLSFTVVTSPRNLIYMWTFNDICNGETGIEQNCKWETHAGKEQTGRDLRVLSLMCLILLCILV